MEEGSCVVCDGKDSPVAVSRVSSVISSLNPGLNELQTVETYTAFLKAGVLSDLHIEVRSMLLSGVSKLDAATYVDETIARVLSANSTKPDPVADDYGDDWSLEPRVEREPVEEEFVGDGWGDASAEGDYSDDWF